MSIASGGKPKATLGLLERRRHLAGYGRGGKIFVSDAIQRLTFEGTLESARFHWGSLRIKLAGGTFFYRGARLERRVPRTMAFHPQHFDRIDFGPSRPFRGGDDCEDLPGFRAGCPILLWGEGPLQVTLEHPRGARRARKNKKGPTSP